MDLQKMKELVADAVNDADLRPEEIPAIDLYLDQITSLASGKLKDGSPRFYDRVLTKTMVNNYSKDGLLAPINGKKYSREHFVQMLLVYAMKNTLSIGEIKRILQNVYKLPDYNADALTGMYDRFLDIKQYAREQSWDFVEAYLNGAELDISREDDFFVMLLGLSAMSSYLKNTVQALLEAHYPDPGTEKEREERERREELRRVKEEKKKASATRKKGSNSANSAEPEPKPSPDVALELPEGEAAHDSDQ